MNTKIAARWTEQKPAVPARPLAETIKRITTDSSAIIAVTTVLLFILACIFVNEFATVTNLRALFLSVALVGIAAVGLSIITIVGRLFALSVSAMVAVSTIVFASLLQTGPWTAMAAAVLFGAVAGAVQGFFVGRLGTDPIVTTIAAAAILIGFAQIVTGGRNVQGAGDASVFGQTIFGVVPVQVLAFFVLTVLAWWTHRYTVLGRRVTLVGLNEKQPLSQECAPGRWSCLPLSPRAPWQALPAGCCPLNRDKETSSWAAPSASMPSRLSLSAASASKAEQGIRSALQPGPSSLACSATHWSCSGSATKSSSSSRASSSCWPW